MPEPISSEIVDVDSWKKLDRYILSKRDAYNQYYKKSKKPYSLGHRYTTHNGGVKVSIYKPPIISKI
jgi:hypothetical protein